MLAGHAGVDYGHELLGLPGTPWSIRVAVGPAGRPALEMYRGAALIDVMVAQSLAPVLLRQARRVARHGQMFCAAWGSLPADGGHVRVEFRTGRLRRRGWRDQRVLTVPADEMCGQFWIATATGRFDRVTVTSLDSRDQCSVRTLRAGGGT